MLVLITANTWPVPFTSRGGYTRQLQLILKVTCHKNWERTCTFAFPHFQSGSSNRTEKKSTNFQHWNQQSHCKEMDKYMEKTGSFKD